MTTEELFINEWAAWAEETTTSFRSVLVPIDFGRVGDRALATAATLAARAPVRVRLATTISPGIDTSRDEADLAARVAGMGVDSADIHIVETDDVPAGLSAVLRSLPSPLLCIASHGRTVVGEMLFGSTTDDLLRAVVSPTLVIGPEADAGVVPTTLAVCVDPDGASPHLLRAARAWQRTFGGHIQLVEVVQPSLTPRLLPDGLVQAAHELRAPMCTVESHDPAQALIELALDRDVVLAVASHLRHRLARAVLGSVAWEVIQRSPTAVLIVPARGGEGR